TPLVGFCPAQRTVRWVTPSLPARRATALASAADSGRSAWSTVTATSLGPRRKPARQCAARTSSAVESGPPDTASTRRGDGARSPKRAAASAGEPGSAAGTLLFLLHALPHGGPGAGILASPLQEGGASRLLLLQGGQRLPEPHQGFGGLARFLVLGG